MAKGSFVLLWDTAAGQEAPWPPGRTWLPLPACGHSGLCPWSPWHPDKLHCAGMTVGEGVPREPLKHMGPRWGGRKMGGSGSTRAGSVPEGMGLFRVQGRRADPSCSPWAELRALHKDTTPGTQGLCGQHRGGLWAAACTVPGWMSRPRLQGQCLSHVDSGSPPCPDLGRELQACGKGTQLPPSGVCSSQGRRAGRGHRVGGEAPAVWLSVLHTQG